MRIVRCCIVQNCGQSEDRQCSEYEHVQVKFNQHFRCIVLLFQFTASW